MNSFRKSIRFGAAALVAASVSLVASTGFATPSYDGVWSVSITTVKGDCIASYRYPMKIEHGVLANGGDVVVNVSGKVASNGAVKVVLTHGDTRADGSGKLAANAGSGSWKTQTCSGSWTAERRS